MLYFILSYLGWSIAGIYLLWLFYIAVMDMRSARDVGTLTTAAKVMGYPILFIGLGVDLLVNVFAATLVFLDLPKELTVTGHVQRLVDGKAGWRKTLALWFAVNLLNSMSIGSPHITIPVPLPPIPAQ